MKLLLAIIFISLLCSRTNPSRKVYLSQLGWSFDLPSEFGFSDSAFNQTGQIDESLWDTPSFDSRKRLELFWIRLSKNDYFNTIIYIDSSDLKKWTNDIYADSRFYIELLRETPQLIVVDTLLSTENIGRLDLQKECIKIYNTVTKDTTYSYKFSRKYSHYSINMNIRYKDKQLGNKLMATLKSSKFDY
jgi:hypothetical protein